MTLGAASGAGASTTGPEYVFLCGTLADLRAAASGETRLTVYGEGIMKFGLLLTVTKRMLRKTRWTTNETVVAFRRPGSIISGLF